MNDSDLFRKARKLLMQQVVQHVERCGCTDDGEEPCGGIPECIAFLKKTRGPKFDDVLKSRPEFGS